MKRKNKTQDYREFLCLKCKHKGKRSGSEYIKCKNPVKEIWGELESDNITNLKMGMGIANNEDKLVLSFEEEFKKQDYPNNFNPRLILGCPNYTENKIPAK